MRLVSLTIEEIEMDHDHRPAPRVVGAVPGRVLAPEPFAADYHQELPDEIFALIDELCPQDILSKGRVVAAFEF